MPEGFGTGFLEGMQGAQGQQQAADQHQLAQLGLQEGQLKMLQTKQQMDMTKLTLDRQNKYMAEIARINGMAHAPGSTPTTPQDQARNQAKMHFDMAEAALAAGLPEESNAQSQLGGKLAENAAKIDEQEAVRMKDMAGFTSNMMQWVKEAAGNPKEFQDRWRKSLLLFQGQFGQESPYAKQQPTEEMVDGLIRAASTRKDEADIKLKAAATAKDYAQASLAEHTKKHQDAIDARQKAAQEFREKHGSTGTKKEQAQADAIQTALDSIEDMQGIIARNKDKKGKPTKTLTGVVGEAHAVAESVAGFFGSGAETPARDVQTDTLVLKSVVNKALTGSNYSSKDKMAISAALADIQQHGMGGKVGENRLEKLKGLLKQKQGEMGIKPTQDQPAMSMEDYGKSIGLGEEEEE